MRIDEFLKQSFVRRPEKGAAGEESDWLEFCDLQVVGKCIWVGDANFVPHEADGFLVAVDPGCYSVTAKAIDFGGDKRVSRLRVCPQGAQPDT